jgi:hypothetical protein
MLRPPKSSIIKEGNSMMLLRQRFLLSLLPLMFWAALALADDSGIQILAPADGAMLDAKAEHQLSYEVSKGRKGDHVHVYVDSEEVGTLHKRKGSYTFKALASGEREVCIKVVSRGHTPVGMERCIKVTVE